MKSLGGADSNEYTVIQTAHPTPRSSWSGSESGRETSSMESTHKDLPQPPLTRLPSAMPTPLPPPPSQWQGTEPMQQWLLAKTEEDRRSQEEEKTRQETLRLEQRRVEQMILMESLRAGVPPPMIPLIFAGMNSSGGGKVQTMMDTVQQWMQQNTRGSTASNVQPHAYQASVIPTTLPPLQQPPGPPTPGEHQRDPRAPAQSASAYAPQRASMSVLPASHMPSGNGSSISAAAGAPTPLPAPRPINKQPAPVLGAMKGSISHIQYIGLPNLPQNPPMRQDPRLPHTSSPSISFHHWVPPEPQNQGPPAKGQTEQSAPPDLVPPMTRSESQFSPNRKRKSQAAHIPTAAPSVRAEPTQQETQSGRQSPDTRTPQQTPTPQSSGLTSYEFRRHHEDPESQRRDSTEQVSPRTRYGRPAVSYVRHEHHPQNAERGPRPHYQQATASDGEDPSQDTGGSTRSGSGATGGTADPERP